MGETLPGSIEARCWRCGRTVTVNIQGQGMCVSCGAELPGPPPRLEHQLLKTVEGAITRTYALVSEKSREIAAANGELHTFRRKPTEAQAFYLPSGHYKVQTISGEIAVEAPTWIVFDHDAQPYPVDPDIFEKTWEPVE